MYRIGGQVGVSCGRTMNNLVREFSTQSHLMGSKYFRVVYGKTDKLHSVGLHKHDFVEILWVKSGSGLLLSGGKERCFAKNFLYISKPGEIHVLDPDGGVQMDFTYVAIDRQVMENFGRDVLSEEGEFYRENFLGTSLKLTQFEISFLNKAASELAWQNDSLVAIYRFLINLYWQVKNAFVSALPSDTPVWLGDACGRIRNPENLAKGLPKFREICGKDMSYINRAMRKYMDCTPTEFINDARLRYAKWLLENSSFSEGEISETCGFSDLPYFCRKFRDKYECTPSDYRRRVRNPVVDQHTGSSRHSTYACTRRVAETLRK